jgi:hypothetical protein
MMTQGFKQNGTARRSTDKIAIPFCAVMLTMIINENTDKN